MHGKTKSLYISMKRERLKKFQHNDLLVLRKREKRQLAEKGMNDFDVIHFI
jgi:hypothetical protein